MQNDEREYQEFIIKITTKAAELKRDYEKLSVENQKRIANYIESFLEAHNCAVTATEILKIIRRQ